MVALTAEELLQGPRGRGLCMAVAHQLSEDVWSAWLEMAWSPSDASRHAALLKTIVAVDSAPVREWADPAAFIEPMGESVISAMYWQPPHETDMVLADPEVTAALYPIAEAIAAAPAAAWWTSPVDLAALRYTSLFDDGQVPTPPPATGARARLSRWRERTLASEVKAAAERPADPAAPVTGCWWSTPMPESVVSTTRPLAGLGSVTLVWQEESLLDECRAAIWSLVASREPRVWEIDRPESWTRLVEHYPLEVTHARRHDWYKTTGRDSPWYIPDWRMVAEDWDVVHLPVAGYLTTATRALPLADGEAATVLAGWDPDQAWWLTDTLTPTTPHPQFWNNPDDPYDWDFAWYRTAA